MEERTIKTSELLDVLRSVRSSNEELFNFFLYSCENENLQLCQLCLDAGADINIRNYARKTLINELIDRGRLTTKVADWLISKGIDINATDGWSSPFSKACYRGNFEIAKYLSDKDAKINMEYDCVGSNDLEHAVDGGNTEIVKLLFEIGGVDLKKEVKWKFSSFHRAIRYKKTNIVEVFLQKGVSPNVYFSNGMMPLHIAVEEKDTETARLLLKYKADVNAKLKKASNPIKSYIAITSMDIAVFNDDTDMQELLLEFGGCASSKEERINAFLEYYHDDKVSTMIKKILAS